MDYEKLQAIAKRSASNVKTLILEMEDDIGQAVEAAAEQAEADGKESLVIQLSHGIKLDLGKNKREDTLSVSVKHKGTITNEIPDPNQPELEGFDDVTMEVIKDE